MSMIDLNKKYCPLLGVMNGMRGFEGNPGTDDQMLLKVTHIHTHYWPELGKHLAFLVLCYKAYYTNIGGNVKMLKNKEFYKSYIGKLNK